MEALPMEVFGMKTPDYCSVSGSKRPCTTESAGPAGGDSGMHQMTRKEWIYQPFHHAE
ncbi:hypothetical protein ABIE06_004508 [Pantoea dispersa]